MFLYGVDDTVLLDSVLKFGIRFYVLTQIKFMLWFQEI